MKPSAARRPTIAPMTCEPERAGGAGAFSGSCSLKRG